MNTRSSISSSAALCAKTPTITVVSPERQTLRTVDYHRAEQGQAQRRIHKHCHDLSLHMTEQWDPRQYTRLQEGEQQPANIRTLHSLSGRTLATRSVDAGNRTTLFNVSGMVAQTWDSRGTQNAIDYDALGRHRRCGNHWRISRARPSSAAPMEMPALTKVVTIVDIFCARTTVQGRY